MKSSNVRNFILLLSVCFSSTIQSQCWLTANTHSKYQASAIKTDGTMWVWGIYYLNGDQSVLSPLQVGNDHNWQSISTGWGFRVALKNDGTLWSWGSSYGGVLGNGSVGAGFSGVTQVGIANDWQYVDCSGGKHTIALKTNGSLWSWGQCTTGELGQGSFNMDIPTPTQIGQDIDWESVAVGLKLWYSVGGVADQKGSSAAIKTDGSVWVWGNNEWGQLGDGSIINKSVPTFLASSSNWATVSIGGGRTMVVKTDGTLWASGLNDYGQFGNGTLNNSNTFIQIGTETNWQEVAAGQEHTVALKNNGTLWAWGDNQFGSVGNGNNVNSALPVQIGADTDWVKISAGKSSSSALKSDGSLWSWGAGTYGVLGIGALGDYSFRNYPVQVACQPLAVAAFPSEDFIVYPNPAIDFLNLNIQDNQIDRITVSEMSGKKIIDLYGNRSQLDIQGLARGMYIIQIFSAEKYYYQKFVKE